MRKLTSTLKTCPLLNEKCLTTGCELYHEQFQRCIIGLLAHNVYFLTMAIKDQSDAEKREH